MTTTNPKAFRAQLRALHCEFDHTLGAMRDALVEAVTIEEERGAHILDVLSRLGSGLADDLETIEVVAEDLTRELH